MLTQQMAARAAALDGKGPRKALPRRVRARDPIRALAYLRVSGLAQEKHGKNLQGQLDEVREYCERKGYKLDVERDVFRDIVSGARTDRQGYYKLLSRIEKEGEAVIVAWNVSRVGRNTLDGAWLMVKAKEHGYRIETAQEGMDFTADPASELVFDLLTAAAKFQRNTILQDMARGKKTGHKHGRWVVGNPPYGYTPKGPRGARVLVPNEHAPVAREVFARYASGETAQAIARDLRARGAAEGGRPWAPNMVGRILDSPVYVGLLEYNGDIVQGQHEPLVDQDTWEFVQKRRAESRARYKGRPRRDAE